MNISAVYFLLALIFYVRVLGASVKDHGLAFMGSALQKRKAMQNERVREVVLNVSDT